LVYILYSFVKLVLLVSLYFTYFLFKLIYVFLNWGFNYWNLNKK